MERVAAGLLLFAPAIASAQLLSPGALSRAHAELEGDARCGSCHASGRRVSDALCTRCHADVGATVRARSGLHGREYRGRECGSCHVEHRGEGARLVRWPGGSRERFDHDLAGYPLAGGHRGVSCRECHDERNERGARTFLGLETSCRSCHEDPHERRFGASCESCHDVSRWSALRLGSFDHARARFALRGAHQRVACAECHRDPPRYRGIEFSTCASCHRDPHAGQNGDDCARCHTESSWSELGSMRTDHPWLRLSNGHSRLACADCHDAGVDEGPSRGSRCVDCHRAVHEASFGNRCESCHASIVWAPLPRAIGLRAHPQTSFALRGAHADVECAGCHTTRDEPRHRVYRGIAQSGCASCHDDAHAGEFSARGGGECGPCHDERGFAPARFGPELHATTSFSLEGRHRSVACNGCHRSGRPRLDWRVAERRCEGCHENPHGDQFAPEMAEHGCTGCHDAASWDRPNVDHASWPLTGAHALAACAACHGAREEGRAASYRGVPRECAGCHEDEHRGQFRLSEPVRECEVCHETAGFRIPRFDHQRLAGYALVGRHAEAECSACHRAERLARGTEAVRWRLGYRECRDCHADPHAGATR